MRMTFSPGFTSDAAMNAIAPGMAGYTPERSPTLGLSTPTTASMKAAPR